MDVVIDASAILAVIAEKPEKRSLVAATVGARLLAPVSVDYEVGNVLSVMQKRGRLPIAKLEAAIDAYRSIPIRFVAVELVDALDLSARLAVPAPDAYVLACAITYKCPLITLDQALEFAARKAKVRLVRLS